MTDQPTAPAGRVRIRESADLDACVEALVEVHAADGYPVEGVDHPQQWLTPPGLLQAWVAVMDDQVVGHNALSAPPSDDAAAKMWSQQSASIANPPPQQMRVAVMERLFVLPTAQGYGLGKRLTNAALDYAREHDLRPVLEVMAKDKAAIHLYEQMGWQYLGRTEHTFGEYQRIPAYCYVFPPG